MAAKGKKDDVKDEVKTVCKNRRAFHEYEISDRLECGLVLVGTEVKSLRDGHCLLEDAYAKIRAGASLGTGASAACGARFDPRARSARRR